MILSAFILLEFIKAFEYFWNSWGATNNRTTRSIYLAPFSLYETEQYLISRGINWNRIKASHKM